MYMYKYLETESTNPFYNLAFEEYCLKNLRQHPRIMLLWQNENSVIIGRYQNAQSEINQTAVKRENVTVVRRSTGGGAVYHDLGNLNYSFITPAEKLSSVKLEIIAAPLLSALHKLGIEAEVQGRNDIVINGLKISGTAQCLHKDRLLHHGTLLYDTDLSMLQKVLSVDTTKLSSKGVKSVLSRVTNIKEITKSNKTTLDFWQDLLGALPDREKITLTDEQLSEITKLADEKYASQEWTMGKSPAYTIKNSKRFSGGKLEITLAVRKGLINNLRISGDFLGLLPAEGLEGALTDLVYDRDIVARAIERLPLSLHLGSISEEEFLSCLFPD